VQLTPATVLVVALGGAVGSLARHGSEVLLGTADGVPVGTLAVNVVGAFALGVLLELPLPRRAEVTRLLLGTGFLGGFTTYSALAMQTEVLMRDGRVELGLAYAIGSVVLGLLAAVGGILVARTVAR